jgi:hypothetical protein
MLTEEAITHKTTYDLSNALFVLAALAMCLCEIYVIRGASFRHAVVNGRIRGKELPYLIWIPAFAGFMMRLSIGKKLRRAEIRPSLAAFFSSSVGAVLLISYLIIARLAEIIYG